MTRGKQPRLSVEDRALWRRVMETVSPLRPSEQPDETAAGEEHAPKARKPAQPGTVSPGPTPSTRTHHPLPSSRLDRRLVRRLGRGGAGVDAMIDLHGLTQAEAHDRLIGFLLQAQASGRRIVLVVTGKGRVGEPSGDWWQEGARGVLRRAVPKWLTTPPLRGIVVGYERAHQRRGGEGAIYVQLRRRERDGGP